MGLFDTITIYVRLLFLLIAVGAFLYFWAYIWAYKVWWKGLIARTDPLWSPPKHDDEDEETKEEEKE